MAWRGAVDRVLGRTMTRAASTLNSFTRTATAAAAQSKSSTEDGHHDNTATWFRLVAATAGGVAAATLVSAQVDKNKLHLDNISPQQLHADAAPQAYMSNSPPWATGGPSRLQNAQASEHYDFVIIGAGQASRAAVETLHRHNAIHRDNNKIMVVGAEARINAVVTSPKDLAELERINGDSNTTVLLGQTVKELDVRRKMVQLDDGRVLSYGKVFIGTGGSHPTGLMGVAQDAKPRVFDFRTIRDIERLENVLKKNDAVQDVTVVGGGWLGTQVALYLNDQAKQYDRPLKVTQMYAEPGVLYHAMPEYFRAYLTARLRDMGVNQRNFTLLSHVEKHPTMDKLVLDIESWDKNMQVTDMVVFAPTTVAANTDLAEGAGLEIDQHNGGIVVNSELMAVSDVYAAGDVISYPNMVLGRRRDQSYDHAISSGVVAAHNMLGDRWQYGHLPTHRTKLKQLNLQFDCVGVVDSRLETIAFWEGSRRDMPQPDSQGVALSAGKYERGVVYYLNNGVVIGIMLVNIDESCMQDSNDAVDAARQALYDQMDYTGVDNVEVEIRDLLPIKPFARTIVKHTNQRAVVRDLPHGCNRPMDGNKNVFKIRRSLMADAQALPQDFLKPGSRRNPPMAASAY